MVEQELADSGYIETQVVKDSRSSHYTRVTTISAKGKRAILDNLNSSELIALIQDGVAFGSFEPAAALVVGVSKEFLPELLSSDCSVVRDAARERLDKLNGPER